MTAWSHDLKPRHSKSTRIHGHYRNTSLASNNTCSCHCRLRLGNPGFEFKSRSYRHTDTRSTPYRDSDASHAKHPPSCQPCRQGQIRFTSTKMPSRPDLVCQIGFYKQCDACMPRGTRFDKHVDHISRSMDGHDHSAVLATADQLFIVLTNSNMLRHDTDRKL